MLLSASTSKIWTPQGTVLSGTGADETNNVGEPTVIYEAGAQILTGTVYKMWYGSGWASPQIQYAESNDGVSWTKYGSNPVLNGYNRGFVYKDGTTYKLYAVPATPLTRFDYYTSSDGLAWTLDTSPSMSVGAAGQWDETNMGNIFVWKEGASDYRTIYEARSGTGAWHLGYATSTDGKTWSKSGSNPILNEAGSTGGPFVYKAADNTYWMWVHRSVSSTTPTDISKYYSTNLTTWTRSPLNDTLQRSASDEGNGSANGQLSDIHMLTVGGQTYAWIGASPDGSVITGHSHIKLFIARLPLSQLIYTNEGF